MGYEHNFTAEELATERWLPVIGFGSLYEASSLGRIKSIGFGYGRRRRVLAQTLSRDGYLFVSLYRNDAEFCKRVHRLVLAAFSGVESPLPVNHISGIKTENRVENLEWCTPAENQAHASRLGLLATGDRSGRRLHPENYPRGDDHHARKHPELLCRGEAHRIAHQPESRPRGERQHLSKLTETDVRAIRYRAEEGFTQSAIADTFGVTQATIWNVVRRKTWKHIA